MGEMIDFDVFSTLLEARIWLLLGAGGDGGDEGIAKTARPLMMDSPSVSQTIAKARIDTVREGYHGNRS